MKKTSEVSKTSEVFRVDAPTFSSYSCGERWMMVTKTLEVQLPESVAIELDALVKGGWFANENEVLRFALLEFARRNRFALIEQFQREDIAWALEQKGKKP